MKLSELLKHIEVLEATADPALEITGISYDSRKTKPGELFVAVKGFETDGHKFIPKAVANGAAAILCEDAPTDGTPYVKIRDCRLGLALVSREFYGNPAGEMKVIGFTGTSGKTSSTHIMKHVLETMAGAKVGLIGTNGNMIDERVLHTEHTTPESLELHQLFRRMKDEGCTHVVMEVSSHSLTLERVAGIDFDVAVFTNLSQDHLDLHGTMEAYAAAKKKIFSQCKIGCVNVDDERGAYMMEGAACPFLRYTAKDKDAELLAEDARSTADGVSFTARYGGESAQTKLAIPGLFSVYNALSVLAACLALGMSLRDAAAGISSAKGVKGRMESVPTDGDYSVIIDYSHKPDALEKALRALRPVTRGRLIVLFGCGGDRDRLKRPIMGRIAAENADLVIVTSDNPRTEDPMDIINEILPGVESGQTPYKMICDRIDAIRWAIDNAAPGDVILLAGKGHEDYQVIGHEKHHMDEREIVAEWLEKRKERQ